MLGGGIFTKQDKILPGGYINFVSAMAVKDSSSRRGTVAMPFTLSWGPVGEVARISREEFEKDSLKLLGYEKESPELLPFREIFKNALTLYYYRLNSSPVRASNIYGEARYGGTRGNALKTVILKNVDNENKYDVKTVVGTAVYETQTAASAAELADNDFICFKKDAALAETAGIPFTGGSDGAGVTGEDYQKFLDRIETTAFHVLGCPSRDEQTTGLFMAFTRRMRDELGIKFQTVVYKASGADYEGIISVDNKVSEPEYGLVYWTAGAEAACEINKSNTNRVYDGEYAVEAAYTQAQLTAGLTAGRFLFHKVGDSIRVLSDINTLVTFTDKKNSDFADNQTVRLLDQMGNDIAGIFSERYMGIIPNDDAGRVSLWNDIVTYVKQLNSMRAIEMVKSEDVTVARGETKRSVVVSLPVVPVSCMAQLYMTIVVS